MNDAILVELRFFWTSVLWGMLLLVIYDVLRILRRVIIHNSFFVSVEDILYWVISSLLIFHMMYQQNNGIIRGFAILAMLLGMLFYHVCASDTLVELISGIINKIIELIEKFISILLWPFKFLFLKLFKLISWIFSKIKKLVIHLLKPLKNIRKSSKMEEDGNAEEKLKDNREKVNSNQENNKKQSSGEKEKYNKRNKSQKDNNKQDKSQEENNKENNGRKNYNKEDNNKKDSSKEASDKEDIKKDNNTKLKKDKVRKKKTQKDK